MEGDVTGHSSAGSPIADAYDAPEFKAFVADYKKNFPDGYPSPSLFALVYYINMKATLDGLDIVKGDLSGISQPGVENPKIAERVKKLHLTDFSFAGCPVTDRKSVV